MSTTMANPQTVARKWYVIDAADKPLGRVATQVSVLLRGKHKTDFTPHVDSGDHVIVLNAGKAVLTGRKLDQKHYRYHTGYVGHLKEIKYRTLMAKRPEFVFMLAVKGMLPKNSLGRSALRRLRVYAGDQHEHAAQKPEIWTVE